jgi:hypothetical protein
MSLYIFQQVNTIITSYLCHVTTTWQNESQGKNLKTLRGVSRRSSRRRRLEISAFFCLSTAAGKLPFFFYLSAAARKNFFLGGG